MRAKSKRLSYIIGANIFSIPTHGLFPKPVDSKGCFAVERFELKLKKTRKVMKALQLSSVAWALDLWGLRLLDITLAVYKLIILTKFALCKSFVGKLKLGNAIVYAIHRKRSRLNSFYPSITTPYIFGINRLKPVRKLISITYRLWLIQSIRYSINENKTKFILYLKYEVRLVLLDDKRSWSLNQVNKWL